MSSADLLRLKCGQLGWLALEGKRALLAPPTPACRGHIYKLDATAHIPGGERAACLSNEMQPRPRIYRATARQVWFPLAHHRSHRSGAPLLLAPNATCCNGHTALACLLFRDNFESNVWLVHDACVGFHLDDQPKLASEDDGVGDLYSYDHQMREAASLELGYSLDEDERMIFRSICKQAGIGDIAGSSSHQSTNNCQTSPTISQPSLYTVTAFPSKSLKPQKMRSFLAVAISPTLLHSIHHKRFSCGNQPEPPTSALGPVPTGNFGTSLGLITSDLKMAPGTH
ncbi:hypothetical protein KEM48_006296 [Puccinia striiformis f. sp. tritici PST-130]|nr:hypothetical protein KEM48_006296 [Puccinia striiformis f. sp. tritici PST-130]